MPRSLSLGPVERRVGRRHQVATVLGIVGEERDAHAGGDGRGGGPPGLDAREGPEEVRHDRLDGGRPIDTGEQDGEFVAAEPRRDARPGEPVGQDAPDAAQHVVAGLVPEEVVDLLEPVEVEAEHGELLPAAARGGEGLLDARVEHRPVRQARQGIVMGEEAHALLGALAGAEVAERDDLVALAGELDVVDQDFDGHDLARARHQRRFGRRAAPAGPQVAAGGLGQHGREIEAGDLRGRIAAEQREAGIGRHHRVAVADQESFDGGVGHRCHAQPLGGGAPPDAEVGQQRHNGQGQDHGIGDRDRSHEVFGGEGAGRDGGARIEPDGEGADRHGVVAAGPGRQQQREAQAGRAPPAPPDANRRRRECDPDAHRQGQEAAVALDGAGDLIGGHAAGVHEGDADADDRAAGEGRPAPRRHGGDAQAEGGHHHGDEQGRPHHPGVEAALQPGDEALHGEEMGGPDAGPARQARQGEPDRPAPPPGRGRMGEEVDQHEAGQQAEAEGDDQGGRVVPDDEIAVVAEHRPVTCRVDRATMPHRR